MADGRGSAQPWAASSAVGGRASGTQYCRNATCSDWPNFSPMSFSKPECTNPQASCSRRLATLFDSIREINERKLRSGQLASSCRSNALPTPWPRNRSSTQIDTSAVRCGHSLRKPNAAPRRPSPSRSVSRPSRSTLPRLTLLLSVRPRGSPRSPGNDQSRAAPTIAGRPRHRRGSAERC